MQLGPHPCPAPLWAAADAAVLGDSRCARLRAAPAFLPAPGGLLPWPPWGRGGPPPGRRARARAPPGRPPRCAARPCAPSLRCGLRRRSLPPLRLGSPSLRCGLGLGLALAAPRARRCASRGPRGPPALLCGAALRAGACGAASRPLRGPPAPALLAARPRPRGLAPGALAAPGPRLWARRGGLALAFSGALWGADGPGGSMPRAGAPAVAAAA